MEDHKKNMSSYPYDEVATDEDDTDGRSNDSDNTRSIHHADSKEEDLYMTKEVRENDVLLGRGTGPNEHSGNRFFRKVVDEAQSEFAAADRPTKNKIVEKTIEVVKNKNGRFLRKLKRYKKPEKASTEADSNSVCYEIVDDGTVIEKTRQAFRYCEQKLQVQQQKSNTTTMTPDSKNKKKGGGTSPRLHSHKSKIKKHQETRNDSNDLLRTMVRQQEIQRSSVSQLRNYEENIMVSQQQHPQSTLLAASRMNSPYLGGLSLQSPSDHPSLYNRFLASSAPAPSNMMLGSVQARAELDFLSKNLAFNGNHVATSISATAVPSGLSPNMTPQVSTSLQESFLSNVRMISKQNQRSPVHSSASQPAVSSSSSSSIMTSHLSPQVLGQQAVLKPYTAELFSTSTSPSALVESSLQNIHSDAARSLLSQHHNAPNHQNSSLLGQVYQGLGQMPLGNTAPSLARLAENTRIRQFLFPNK